MTTVAFVVFVAVLVDYIDRRARPAGPHRTRGRR